MQMKTDKNRLLAAVRKHLLAGDPWGTAVGNACRVHTSQKDMFKMVMWLVGERSRSSDQFMAMSDIELASHLMDRGNGFKRQVYDGYVVDGFEGHSVGEVHRTPTDEEHAEIMRNCREWRK